MARKSEKAATEATEETKESKKAPKPEGYVSPVEYAKHRSEVLGKEIRPQTIYGVLKNSESNGFPVEKNTDGRYMVNVEAADKWYADREAARAAKAAEKEAAEDS